MKNVDELIIHNESISKGIIDEGNKYDAVMVGATRKKGLTTTPLFGGIPLQIAKELNNTVIVVKHHNPVKALVGRVVGE